MEKDFDHWNTLKKHLAAGAPTPPAFPKPGEIWICALGHNLGREQNGSGQAYSRPVLFVHKFNNEMLGKSGSTFTSIMKTIAAKKSLPFWHSFDC